MTVYKIVAREGKKVNRGKKIFRKFTKRAGEGIAI